MTLTWVKFNLCPCRCKTFTYFIFRLTITFKWLRVDELRYPEQLALATLIFLISFSTMLLLYLVCKVFQERVLLFYIVATPLKILGRFFWQHHFILGSFLVSLVLLPQVVYCLGTAVYLHSLAENTSPIESPQVHKRPPS